jgi:hypothetical protein
MNLECDFTEALKAVEGKPREETIRRGMQRIGVMAEEYAKAIINTFKKAKGTSQGVDSGSFRDGIRSESIEDGFGFRVHDSVPYGIYHEFGTEKHWLPFFDEGGELTGLGDWAQRHFDEIGFEVKGKRGKALKRPSRNQKIDVLKQIGGMMVSLDEMAPFRKAAEYANSIAAKVMKEEMANE